MLEVLDELVVVEVVEVDVELVVVLYSVSVVEVETVVEDPFFSTAVR